MPRLFIRVQHKCNLNPNLLQRSTRPWHSFCRSVKHLYMYIHLTCMLYFSGWEVWQLFCYGHIFEWKDFGNHHTGCKFSFVPFSSFPCICMYVHSLLLFLLSSVHSCAPHYLLILFYPSLSSSFPPLHILLLFISFLSLLFSFPNPHFLLLLISTFLCCIFSFHISPTPYHPLPLLLPPAIPHFHPYYVSSSFFNVPPHLLLPFLLNIYLTTPASSPISPYPSPPPLPPQLQSAFNIKGHEFDDKKDHNQWVTFLPRDHKLYLSLHVGCGGALVGPGRRSRLEAPGGTGLRHSWQVPVWTTRVM